MTLSISCRHSWCYVNAVYHGDIIRRYCSECGKEQYGKVVSWRAPRTPRFFDESAAEAAKKEAVRT